jgi:multidrug efflux pump subunit AcrB
MRAVFAYFAQHRILAYMITLLVLLSGTGTLFTIQRDMFPNVEFGEIIITTRYPGASPEDVELKVTNKIEDQLRTVEGIKHFSSWSTENFSMIHIVIHPDEPDHDEVVMDVRDAVNRATDLPREIIEAPYVKELTTSEFPMIEVGLTGDIPYAELKELARQLEKRLQDIPGVSRLERYGWRDREIRIEVSPEKLLEYELPVNRVIAAIRARNIQATGGSFESYLSEKNIVTLAEFRDPLDAKNVVTQTTFHGPLVRLKDIATIKDDFEKQRVISRVNGESAISFIALKSKSADIVRTVDAIKSLLEKEQSRLPEGVRAVYSHDASKYVRNRFSIVGANGALGLVMLIAILALSLNVRIAFWVALGIPVAMLGTIFMLPVFGLYLDSITMTALVLVIGIVVDDAIIIAEQIYKEYESGKPPLEAAVDGVCSVFKPVLTTVLTTFVAFAPLFFMPGMLGKFVYVIPLAISLALFVSLIEACLALPSHIAGGLPRSHAREDRRNRLSAHMQEKFSTFIGKLLRWRIAVILAFIAILAGTTAWAAHSMTIILFPSETADTFIISLETESGTSLQATLDKTVEVENIIRELPKSELDSYVTRVGLHGDVIAATESEHYATILVSLAPFTGRKRTADQIVEQLRSEIEGLSGIKDVSFEIDAGGPPVGRPIMIRIVGSNDELRRKLASDVFAYLKTIEGVKDIERNDRSGKEQIEIKLDYDRLAKLGLTVADVAQTVRVAYDGEVVTSVRYGEDDVAFRVIYPISARAQPGYLSQLHVANQDGRLIPITQFAGFKAGPGPANFNHYKGERSIVVSADIDTGITTSVTATNNVLGHFGNLDEYPGMRFEVGGEAEETNDSMHALALIFIFAVLGVYCLLILLFDSLWQPLLIIVSLPFAVAGVIVTLVLHNEPLGFLAVIGMIGLAGVVVNDSLVLVNRINEIHKTNPQLPLIDVIAYGVGDRLRAVLLTSITTIVGLLPLAYGLGGADPYMSPMALVLGYGLLFATPITLILVPCLYLAGQEARMFFSGKRI